MKRYLFGFFALIVCFSIDAHEFKLTETASIDQIYGLQVESESLLPMNDLNIDLGYTLYQADIKIESEDAVFEVENVRDFATVYVNGELQGELKDGNKKLLLRVKPGNYIIQLYAENIGRITYGPEILDNSKGLFGECFVDGESVKNWKITELKVRNCNTVNLQFTENKLNMPSFHRGNFELDVVADIYLDVNGLGMGEAWVNGCYIGSYWEAEKQRTILIPASILKKGLNEVVIFELKNNRHETLKLSKIPIFN